jgi:hypothetical protein
MIAMVLRLSLKLCGSAITTHGLLDRKQENQIKSNLKL